MLRQYDLEIVVPVKVVKKFDVEKVGGKLFNLALVNFFTDGYTRMILLIE